jgi:hypothetical protein
VGRRHLYLNLYAIIFFTSESFVAVHTGVEPAPPTVTVWYLNRLTYGPYLFAVCTGFEPVISSVTGRHPLHTGPTDRILALSAGFEPATLGLTTHRSDRYSYERIFARLEGFEPSSSVLETGMLPLHHRRK